MFELHQYLIFLLRKMQNTFSEPVAKKMGDGSFSQKGNYQPNDRELFLIMFQVDSLYHLMAALLKNAKILFCIM